MTHRHDKTDHKINMERVIWECQRAFASFRRGPSLALIPFQIVVLLLVWSKGAGPIYLDLLPILVAITLISSFLVCLVHGNQKILLFSMVLLTVGTMLQSIFKEEIYLKNPEKYAGKLMSAGLQAQYLLGFLAAVLIAFFYWKERQISSIRWAEILTIVSIVISLLTILLSKGTGGVRNWISIGSFSVQTTEIVKFLYLFIAAALLGTLEKPDKERLAGFYLISFIDMGFLVIQSEFGTLLLLLMVFLTFLFMFVPDLRVFAVTILSMAVMCVLMVFVGLRLQKLAAAGNILGTNPLAVSFLSNFQKISNRFIYWLHPEKDSAGQGYQLLKAKESIVSGGWFGTSSVTSLPVKTSDLVFPALIQRCGMIFALLVFLVFILLWLEGMKICVRKKDKYHRMMAVGLISMFLDQTIIIIAGSTGLCPLTGITLPFISSGGSSLVISFMIMSVLICISGNISWKGQNSEEVKFFEKGTDCAERVFASCDRHVHLFIQNIRTSARSKQGGRPTKSGGKTGGV